MGSVAFGPQPTEETVATNELIAGGYIADPYALSLIPLPGEIEGVPGGNTALPSGGFYASDPAGIGGVMVNPAINPNPTGGWQQTMQQLLQSGVKAFTAFEQGSPAVATPRPAVPTTSVLGKIFTAPTGPGQGIGPFSWGALAAIGIGVAALVVIAKVA